MNPQFRWYLNNTLVPDPQGWEAWKSYLERDHEMRGVMALERAQLTFSGEAFAIIREVRKLGFCQLIDVFVEEACAGGNDYAPAFRGYIFVSGAKLNVTKCNAQCELVDNSFFSRINNNKQLEVSLNAGKSKNGSDIADLPIYQIQMYDPCTGVDLATPVALAYRFHDAGSYLINFMTDGLVSFRSTALDIGGEFEGAMLTNGLLVRDPQNAPYGVLLTFENYLKNVCRLCDLSWYIDYTSGLPVFVLERTDDTLNDTVRFTVDNVYQIIQSIDQARNFAAVTLGTADIIESLGCAAGEGAFPDQINLFGCKQEQYAVTGTCNINAVLDLGSDWVISSNVIASIYIDGDDSYDGDIIVIDCETLDTTLLTADAIKGDVFGIPPEVYYNTRFFNYEVAKRNLKRIPSTLVKYLNQEDTGFRAQRTHTETITVPATIINTIEVQWTFYPFGDDFTAPNFDLSNEFGNGTVQGALIAQMDSCFSPLTENVFRFRFGFDLFLTSGTLLTGTIIRATWKRYDSGMVLIASYPVEITVPTFPINPTGITIESPSIFLSAGDLLFLQVNYAGSHKIDDPIYHEMISSGTQGGQVTLVNSEDYIAENFEVEVPMSSAQFLQIKNKPIYKLEFTDVKGNIASGWVESIEHHKKSGIAKIKLLSAAINH